MIFSLYTVFKYKLVLELLLMTFPLLKTFFAKYFLRLALLFETKLCVKKENKNIVLKKL